MSFRRCRFDDKPALNDANELELSSNFRSKCG